MKIYNIFNKLKGIGRVPIIAQIGGFRGHRRRGRYMEFTMFCPIRGRVLSERLWKSRITLFVKNYKYSQQIYLVRGEDIEGS